MSTVGSHERPVRVAVVGAGPAGFFAADALLRKEAPIFKVDLFERLPTPFGLVRSGVAPDHQKIKSVTRTFEKTAHHGRFRFLGNVNVGKDLTAAELAAHYDMVIYAVGSSTDRRLGIPGEHLAGSHAATAFVGWYNAHPDFHDFKFDLNVERAVVVGVGNVAIDVARVLLRDRDELAKTDIAGPALEALRASSIREVVLVARRGAAQAAFTPSELEDLIELPAVSVRVDPRQLELDDAQMRLLDTAARRNLELMRHVAAEPRDAPRTLRLEFLASPTELVDDGIGRVCGLRLERNELASADGSKARGTGQFFELATGLVFRSIGYFGSPLPGVPFDPKLGIIPNVEGRVTRTPGGEVLPQTYAVGWIRRSPTGVIGTNKADAQGVVDLMVEDVATLPGRELPELEPLLTQRGIEVTSFFEWARLDELEVAAGKHQGKVREKFASVEAMMNELLRHKPRLMH